MVRQVGPVLSAPDGRWACSDPDVCIAEPFGCQAGKDSTLTSLTRAHSRVAVRVLFLL